MACFSTAQLARLNAKIAHAEAELALIYAAMLGAIPNAEVSRYSLDTGEGKQEVWRRSTSVLQKMSDDLETKIDWLYGKLEGTGLSRITVRRCF